MRILITGGKGLLGRSLQSALKDHKVIVTDIEEMDITDGLSVDQFLTRYKPELVIHCAAYTDVDGSARNPSLAYRINALGTLHVALACQTVGATLVHISTNEVFSGHRTEGYEEWMPVDPINPYGRSKAAAERYVLNTLSNFYIVRTAWLYGPESRNFIQAILGRARQGGQLQVVADEIGNPTYSLDLAQAVANLITTDQYGIYHLVNDGACSRWAFANEVLRLVGLDYVSNKPILSADYRRDSKPPLFGQLQNVAASALGIALRPWREALADYVQGYELS